jgi:RND family efflux transporter MFP subunit
MVGLALVAVILTALPVSAGDYRVERSSVPVMKPVFGQVQSRDTVAARARIGGTVVQILVEEGDAVTAGAAIANIVDEKLALQLEAVEARQSAISAQLENAKVNLKRAEQLFSRGTIARTRVDELQTQVNVLDNQIIAIEADKAVIVQRAEEGSVIAPSSGRILSVPVTVGSVILPGEPIARIAGGGYYLRLSLPERHAAGITVGETVAFGGRGLPPEAADNPATSGTVVKVYPEITEGRVTADVEVDGLGDFFVGERTLVSIPVGRRDIVAVPRDALSTRHGGDYVTLREDGHTTEVSVIPGDMMSTDQGLFVEILTGIRPGDVVVLP